MSSASNDISASNVVKFRVVETSFAGRALVATSDIATSQIIVTDKSSLVAPITHNSEDFEKSIFCVACFKILVRTKFNDCTKKLDMGSFLNDVTNFDVDGCVAVIQRQTADMIECCLVKRFDT